MFTYINEDEDSTLFFQGEGLTLANEVAYIDIQTNKTVIISKYY